MHFNLISARFLTHWSFGFWRTNHEPGLGLFTVCLKVALSQKILDNFSIANINIPNYYPEQKIWISCLLFEAENLNFLTWNSDLEYLCWQWKNYPVSSDLKLPLINFQGRNPSNFWLAFWEKRWPLRFILNLTDL